MLFSIGDRIRTTFGIKGTIKQIISGKPQGWSKPLYFEIRANRNELEPGKIRCHIISIDEVEEIRQANGKPYRLQRYLS